MSDDTNGTAACGGVPKRDTVHPGDPLACVMEPRSGEHRMWTRTLLTLTASVTAGQRAWLAPLNTPTTADRRVLTGDPSWRETTPLMFSDTEAGHGDAVFVGNLTGLAVTDRDGVAWVTADVDWLDGDATAERARGLVESGRLPGVSVAALGETVDMCWDEATSTGTVINWEDPPVVVDQEGNRGLPCDWETMVTAVVDPVIVSATIVTVPAFDGALIADATDTGTPNPTDTGTVPGPVDLNRPPDDWFTRPDVDGPVPGMVTDDGRVFRYVALWDTCHIGFGGQCVTPPRGASYKAFLTGQLVTASGAVVPVGPLVVDDGHAPVDWSVDRVGRYYANTLLAAAYVTVGEDEYGVWVAGALSPRASLDQTEVLRRHPLSGDWRPLDGGYGLVAAVAVNSPGFVVPHVLAAASGDPGMLVTVGDSPVPVEPVSDLVLVAAAIEALAGRVSDTLARLDAEALNAAADRVAEALGVAT